eukprot:SM000019S04974  [mRNA]  locus=s19:346696:351164:+ [translate_table: standard]
MQALQAQRSGRSLLAHALRNSPLSQQASLLRERLASGLTAETSSQIAPDLGAGLRGFRCGAYHTTSRRAGATPPHLGSVPLGYLDAAASRRPFHVLLGQAGSAVRNYSGGGLGVREALEAAQQWRTRLVSQLQQRGSKWQTGVGHPGRSLRRFSSEGPKKKDYENFYPKNKKELPRGQREHKTEGREEGKSEQQKGFDNMYKEYGGQMQSLVLTSLVTAAVLASLSVGRPESQEISFQEFKNKLLEAGVVDRIEVSNKNTAKVYVYPQKLATAKSEFSDLSPSETKPPQQQNSSQYKFYFNIGSIDSFERKLEDAQDALGMDPHEYVPVTYVTEMSWQNELLRLSPTLLLVAAYVFFTRRMQGGLGVGGGGGGGARGIFNVGKAQVTKVDKNSKNKLALTRCRLVAIDHQVYFKDVAGCDEAKQEVMEFVHFLKNPKKYQELGAKIPKGALLVGPPGTGKTLLAKATAGEAGVPFLSISGSDFMEMFVGVGPSRVRDLFAQARSAQPSIIFIDEIDAIGRARGRGGFAGGNDERENTLNQLLVEMDGFASTSGVVILAGTNRPDILDPALLRPGRFDRQIAIDRPDINGREQIFQIYLKKLKLDKDVTFYSQRMAALTPGFAGADIANVANEAALIAARNERAVVIMDDFESAIDRIIGGLEKKKKVISKEERRTVAYHEAGHAVAGWFLEHAEPLLKVSIVPRGTAALGFAQYLPNENLLMTKEQLLDMTCMTLGGRASEEVRRPLGSLLSFPQRDQGGLEGLNKPYGNQTAEIIDVEVREWVDKAYKRTLAIMKEHRAGVEALAQQLLLKEVLHQEDLVKILGPRPFTSAELTNYDKFKQGFAGNEELNQGKDKGEEVEEDSGKAESPGDGSGGGLLGVPALAAVQGTL